MLLSRSGEYSLRALAYLAQRPEGEPVSTAEIATALDLPANYLSKLLHKLTRAGVLDSSRGPQGGFALALPADELSLARALEPIEAERLTRRCLLGRPECSDADPCAAHDAWRSVAGQLDAFLRDTTVAELLPRRARSARRRR